MTYSVISLITGAYYASGIVSREFQTVSGAQMGAGLQILNDIITDKTIEKDMIPYFTKYEFFAVAGQEEYFIPNLESVETLVFFINNVRYQMRPLNRKVYFGSSRAENINSLPFNWHIERSLGGAKLFMYFKPQTNYPIQLWGTFRLTEVSINQNLSASQGEANLGTVFTPPATTPMTPQTFTLNQGQLVVNNVDLAGTYTGTVSPFVSSLSVFLTYVNSGVIPNITAQLVGTQFIFNSNQGANINVTTTGDMNFVNFITFANFSTQNGPLNQTFLSQGLDRFYINYLKYSLADRLCSEYNFIVPPGVAKQLLQYQLWISKRSAPLDMTQTKISSFSNGNTLSWGQINIGLGWSPPG